MARKLRSAPRWSNSEGGDNVPSHRHQAGCYSLPWLVNQMLNPKIGQTWEMEELSLTGETFKAATMFGP